MLKTNSKKARENTRNYIIEHFDATSYTETPPTEWHEIAEFIYNCFRSEKYSIMQDFQYYKYNELHAFIDWCQGLPSVLDTCYYYNRSAVNDLGAVLEETQSEKAKYSEDQAETLLTKLIYQELFKEVKKYVRA
ncbi:MAG: hypothetical protein IJN75_04310 [Clostridia bacterium]|nr:hypothetical protein [Clostridia bacterium]